MNTPQRGRPRSEQARAAILDAARAMLLEVGYENLAIEAVAGRAEVGRQTIYRWWDSKAVLVADAVLRGGLPAPRDMVIARSGTIRNDLLSWAIGFAEMASEPHNAALIRGLAAATAGSHRTAAELYDQFTGPQHKMLVDRMRGAIERGEVLESSDLEAAIDALVGGILYRVLAQIPVTRAHATALVDVVLLGVAR